MDELALPLHASQVALLDKLCAEKGKSRAATLEEIFARGVYATLVSAPENLPHPATAKTPRRHLAKH